ncbi:unnamed protein product [Durusdinium trenchii]|uniref:RRM domain-containing protein n=1 Tax=Durusdinium trenchii TaxID=1381693 RepID=A0ABP0HT84_9DINO
MSSKKEISIFQSRSSEQIAARDLRTPVHCPPYIYEFPQGLNLGACKRRSIIQAQAMPDGRSDESTIFVAGLPSDMTNLEMYQLFSAFGAIAPRGATALQDKETGKCTGIGFVNFIDSDSAQKAIRALNSFPFTDGSWLTVKKKGPSQPWKHVEDEGGTA